MTEKSRAELQSALDLAETLRTEREISNASYAAKLVERVVYGLVALVLVTVAGAVIASVVK
jgi:hypothetical protein